MKIKDIIKKLEELLDKGYCDCNEMNCIDNNSPRRILNIVKVLQKQLQQKENIIKEVREYVKKNMKIVTKGQAEGTRLPVGTFMWNVDKILEILDGVDKENI